MRRELYMVRNKAVKDNAAKDLFTDVRGNRDDGVLQKVTYTGFKSMESGKPRSAGQPSDVNRSKNFDTKSISEAEFSKNCIFLTAKLRNG